MSNCTPRKHRELMKRGVLLSPNTKKKYDTYTKIVTKVKLHLKDLKKSQTARGRQHYYLITKGLVGKHYIEKSIREALDLKYNYWARLCHLHEDPLPITTKVSDETKESIKSFYIDESENLPTQRMATKKVLTETLKTTYKRFVGKGYEQKVSLSTFIKQRPKQVLTMNMNKFQSCLCEYCVNVEFKLEALGRECVAEDLSELKLDNKYECLKMTLCPSDKEVGKKECYERECLRCGEESICLHFSQLVDKCGDRTVRWKRWELGSVGRPEKKEKRQMLVEKEGTVLDLLKQLTDELKPFAKHILTASWQRKQYQQLIKNLPNDCVVTVMDFAENYRCVNQDEIQSAYYNYSQATLFPCVVHYKCPDCPNAIVEESAVFITPDLKHDSDAVQNFTKKLDEHLKETVSFSREIQFSDGCAAQFKSKTPFTHISEETNHVIERCFFGSRHGKSCCDGLGGLVKSQATKYVRNRKGTIPNAKALYDFCQENLAEKAEEKCSHKKRSFFYVENIQRDLKPEKLMTLPGTRALHNVKAVSPGIVKVRSLACFCHACVSEDDKVKCTNEHIVGNWITRSLRREQKVTNPNQKGVKERKNKRKKKSKPKRSSKCKVKNVKYQCRVDDKTNEQPKKADHINPKESKKKDKSDDMSESNEQKCNGQRENRDIFRNCTTFLKLKRAVQTAEFTQLPFAGNKSYSNTDKIVDNNSLPLVPDDIPLQPTHQLFPCVIYGDGNCLPRAASVYAYGTENNHADMRRRIVKELVENETRYLDNKYMRRGKHPDGDDDVTRTFAMYSDHYMANKQLTPELIRTIYRNEIMTVKERGKWMGLWQIASLANILRRPVVSVTPEHGSFNTRKDMHRVFYPFDDYGEQTPVFFMWTNINGVTEEREFVLNHFTAMMPLTEGVTFSDDECENSPTDCLPGEWIFDNDILNQNIESLIPDEGLSVGSEDTRTDEDTTSSGVEVTTKDAPVPAAGASADNVDQEDNTENESINFQDECNEPSNGIDVTNADTPVPSQTADEPLEGNTTNNTNISKDKCNDSSAEILVTSRDTAGLFTEEVKVQGEVTDNIASTFRGKYYESSKGTDATSTDSFVIGYEEGRSEGVDMTDDNNHYESIAKESSIRTESTITGDSEIGPVEDTSDEVEKGDDDDHFEDIDTKSSIRTESTITCDSEIGPVEGTKEEIDKGDDYDHFEDIDTKSSPMINTNMGDTFSTAEDKGSEGNNVEISSHKDDETSPMINTNMGDTFSTAEDKGSEGNNVEISSHKDDESSPMINTNMGDTFSTAEDKGSEGNNVEISSHKDDESRYNAGDYILIKHGRNHIPGIVDSWPWVKYFYKKKNRWLLNDIRYIIIPTDVVRKLGSPEFYGVGTRMYYKFEVFMSPVAANLK